MKSTQQTICKKIASKRIYGNKIMQVFLNNIKMGIDYDIREDIYNRAMDISFEKLNDFYIQNFRNKPYVYLILGKKEDIDFSVLEKIGELKELTVDEIFKY